MRAGDQKPVYYLEWPKTDYPTHDLAHDPQHADRAIIFSLNLVCLGCKYIAFS